MSAAPPWVPADEIAALPAALRDGATHALTRLADEQAAVADQIAAASVEVSSLIRLFALSEYAAGAVIRQWDWFLGAASSGELFTPITDEELAAQARALGESPDRVEFVSALRRFRHRTLLRILWSDLIEDATLDTTLIAQSALADAAIRAAADYARAGCESRFGTVTVDGQSSPLVILAMGKLGGRELNFSSDVDLILLYPEEAETSGPKTISAHEYFARVARETVALLEEVTPDGFVYRVDTRLRPFGDSGPPVVSFAGLENYLLQHGRGWERYAYVKARVVYPAGATVNGLIDDIIEPFVYRRYLDYGVFESLREMKALVSAEVEKREMADNIKLGPGGIREVEFIVQSLQLVRGGGVRALRTPSLGAAIAAAVDNRDLDAVTADRLLAAYRFLRKVENCVQAVRDQQVHGLPETLAGRERLAFALRMADWDQVSEALDRHRQEVGRQFAAIVFRADADPDGKPDPLAALWSSGADVDEWSAALTARGFGRAEGLATILVDFASRRSTQRVDAIARQRLRVFIPGMLRHLATVDAPAVALRRILDIVDRVLRRSAYLALLNENPGVLDRLLELCATSGYLAQEIARYPVLLDELIDARRFVDAPDADEIRDDLEQRIGAADPDDRERQVEILAEFKRAMLFRLAIADFSGSIPIMKVSDRLTQIAELILSRALALAHADLVARFGQPRYDYGGDQCTRRTAGLGIIAYGKLGGMELSYGSDLDIVFLHDSRGVNQQTDGARPLDNSVFFARLARRLVHFLTTQTGAGALYEIDTRLRPSGRSGLLVTSIEAFERYQEENAWTWEHQALLRSRPVAGSSIVAREFGRIRSQTLLARVRRAGLRAEVAEMRRKMREQNDKSDTERFDIKQGRGGIADIEFLVQYLVLSAAADHPALIHYPDNIRQLGTLAAAGVLDEDDARRLQDIYREFRSLTHRLALDEKPAISAADAFSAERGFVDALWQRVFAE